MSVRPGVPAIWNGRFGSFKWEEKTGGTTLDHKTLGQDQHPETPKGGFGSFLLSKVVAAELQGAEKYKLNSGRLFFNLELPLLEASS